MTEKNWLRLIVIELIKYIDDLRTLDPSNVDYINARWENIMRWVKNIDDKEVESEK